MGIHHYPGNIKGCSQDAVCSLSTHSRQFDKLFNCIGNGSPELTGEHFRQFPEVSCFVMIKANRGQLDPSGKTVTEVRLRAIENMDSAELLSQIAREDPDVDVREKALARLEEIAA